MVVSVCAQVCNDAIALLFMFDLSRKSTLSSVKEWYRQARLLNKSAVPFLIGTKYDVYSQQDEQDREETLKQVRIVLRIPLLFDLIRICSFAECVLVFLFFCSLARECQARKYAAAMKAPLIFCSSAQAINVQKIFKIVLAKVFDLPGQVPKLSGVNEPIIEY